MGNTTKHSTNSALKDSIWNDRKANVRIKIRETQRKLERVRVDNFLPNKRIENERKIITRSF